MCCKQMRALEMDPLRLNATEPYNTSSRMHVIGSIFFLLVGDRIDDK